MVRAKFHCSSVTKKFTSWYNQTTQKWEQQVVYDFAFTVVTGNSPENANFFKWTPSGTLSMSALKEDLFEIGREYYLDFTAAQ